MSTLDDFTDASDGADVDENDECDCDDLPDGVPCWSCYRDAEAEFDRGGAA
ncbi:hypothetical protein [Haloarchaeobius sp. HRN-SO-5]|uniref:hypothetical protein n=1 Tax=Haloarchaeobius sp. HRN-SO-5 TaxID=3446118 RepID=UPI003EBD38CE